MPRSRLLLCALLWLCIPSATALTDAGLAAAQMQRLDEPAPDFTLPDTAGRTLHLATLRGHPVIVHFWATWCSSCRKELPEIEQLAQRMSGTGIEFLTVVIDQDTPRADIDRLVANLGITLPVLRAADGTISERYWTWGVPATYLIDRDGAIAGRALGPRAWDSASMRSLIAQFATQSSAPRRMIP